MSLFNHQVKWWYTSVEYLFGTFQCGAAAYFAVKCNLLAASFSLWVGCCVLAVICFYGDDTCSRPGAA